MTTEDDYAPVIAAMRELGQDAIANDEGTRTFHPTLVRDIIPLAAAFLSERAPMIDLLGSDQDMAKAIATYLFEGPTWLIPDDATAIAMLRSVTASLVEGSPAVIESMQALRSMDPSREHRD